MIRSGVCGFFLVGLFDLDQTFLDMGDFLISIGQILFKIEVCFLRIKITLFIFAHVFLDHTFNFFASVLGVHFFKIVVTF